MTVLDYAPREPSALEMPGGSADLQHGMVFDHPSERVRAFVDKARRGIPGDDRSTAVALYYAVRDGIFYEIFGSYLGPRLSASLVIGEGRGFCLHKAIVYAAACRAAGLSCRLLAARVRNHVSSPSIQLLVGGDIFLHWYNEVKISGEWLKAAPIFNRLTCNLYGIEPLEFDGRDSAVEQPYHGDQTMRFLSPPIVFDDPRAEDLLHLVEQHHPRMLAEGGRVPRERQVKDWNRQAIESAH